MTDIIRNNIDEVITENKARVREQQNQMRKELKEFIDICGVFHLQELHSEFKRMTRNKL
jgi:hypothetical protein